MAIDQSKIRNFSIIAHIDHGKSTLADRILQITGAVADREMKAQLLDSMDLERERGITIKLNAVQLNYTAKDGQTYLLHLIDTPGHVDFTYEVSRSLAACEGAVLVVDAVQGVEAQTLANVYLALDSNLEILPVINKIDLPSANPERAIKEIEDVIGLPADHAPLISAKSGLNVEEVLEKIVHEFPAPGGSIDNPTQALIFDSYYDSYRGVIVFVRIKEGKIKVGDTVRFMATGATYEVTELGVRTPREVKKDELVTGTVERRDNRFVYVKIGNVEAVMPHRDQMPNEVYNPQDQIRVLVTHVGSDSKGAQITVSRTAPDMVKRLFEQEVPEIYDGTVEIVSIAREAGDRTKMAVKSNDPNIDPVGTCVGQKGARVQNVVNELGGENIDIVKYEEDPSDFIANALNPAEVIAVQFGDDEEEKSALVIVPDYQLSLAIGKKGQNVRLAARLTGYKIDIRPESEVEFVDEKTNDTADAADSSETSENVESTDDAADVESSDDTTTVEDSSKEDKTEE